MSSLVIFFVSEVREYSMTKSAVVGFGPPMNGDVFLQLSSRGKFQLALVEMTYVGICLSHMNIFNVVPQAALTLIIF